MKELLYRITIIATASGQFLAEASQYDLPRGIGSLLGPITPFLLYIVQKSHFGKDKQNLLGTSFPP